MTSPALSRLVSELTASGPLRFDAYVERCLYDPDWGFYTAGGGAAGKRGDFLTSPEVGPLFGAVLARALDQWWDDAERPDPFVVVDAGAGPGSLSRSLLAAAPRCSVAWRLTVVERSEALRGGHGDLVASGAASTPELPPLEGAVVLANELLDNLPFRILEQTLGGWVDLAVAAEGDRLRFTHLPVDEPDARRADRLVPAAAPGTRIPWLAGAAQWLTEVLQARPAHVVVFDYGAATTVELAGRPSGSWLRTYRAHGRAGSPLEAPGMMDVTVDLAVDQLPGGATWCSQAEFVGRWGIDELVAEGRRLWAAAAARPDVAALRARSRVREAEALVDPDGLGSWLVGHWAQNPAAEVRAAPR